MKKTRLFSLLLCGIMILSGCGKQEESAAEEKNSDDNHANHGYHAIMETENGYYYNFGYMGHTKSDNYLGYSMEHKQFLRYYDKETGETILLCNKPECEHNGSDSCTATYKKMGIINSVMYDNRIYVYAVEHSSTIISMNLYRVSLDGASIDKVGTVLEVENTLGQGVAFMPQIATTFGTNYLNCFIIHQGYAYLPYYLRIGKASKGFMGGGLAQMNLETGETKIIHELEYMTSSYPYNLRAVGNYVYMDMPNTKRYDITTGTLDYPGAMAEMKPKILLDIITEERLYDITPVYDEETDTYSEFETCFVYDAATGNPLPEEQFETDITPDESQNFWQAFAYEDMLVVAAGNRVIFYGGQGENLGTKLGEIPFEYKRDDTIVADTYGIELTFQISNGKLYKVCNPTNKSLYEDVPDSQLPGTYWSYEVYSCPVEDILSGNGQWTLEFTYTP